MTKAAHSASTSMASFTALQASALILFLVLASIALVQAHEENATENAFFSLSNPLLYIAIASLLTIIILLIALIAKQSLSETQKKLLFWSIALPVMLATLYLAGHTIYLNITSVTRGPVHWHADYEVWVCGEQHFLKDPHGLNNRIGTAVLHEHNDERIHIEGVIDNLHHVDLGSYFESIDGGLADDELAYPSTNGTIDVKNNDHCTDGSTGTLKVYVNGRRISHPADYVPYPSSYVPPGDCIIIAFDSSSVETTGRVCTSWEAKGADYATYKRPPKTIGGTTWQ